MEWTIPEMTRIDWSARREQRIDPYLVWADLTRFESFNTGAAPFTDEALGLTMLRLALELDPDLPAPPWLHGEVVRDQGAVFATASVPLADLGALLDTPSVSRLELCHAGRPAFVPGPAFDGQRVERPVVAVIDFGCAYAHEAFRFLDAGKWCSRIAYLWDQTDGAPLEAGWRDVPDMGFGRELDREAIETLLNRRRPGGPVDEEAIYRDSRHASVGKSLAHGTHVLDLAAGSRSGKSRDELPDIIFVELPKYAVDDTSGGSMVAYVMDALRYIRSRTADGFPIVVNLSYGSMAGPHDGSTLLEQAMDAWIEADMGPAGSADVPSRYAAIVLAAGNNFEADTHAVMTLSAAQPRRELSWQVFADDDSDTFLELWYPKAHAGAVRVAVQPPGGVPQTVGIDDTWILAPAPGELPACGVIHRTHVASGLNDAMVLVALAPTRSRRARGSLAPAGIWTIEVSLVAPADSGEPVEVHAWVERDDQPVGSGDPPRQSKFVAEPPPLPLNAPSPAGALVQRSGTCSSIANGCRTIVVGACLGTDNFEFSRYTSAGPSRNPLRRTDGATDPRCRPWPDLVAPADESRSLPGILAAGTRSGVRVRMNGTSVAAPRVTRQLIGKFLPYRAGTGRPQPSGPVERSTAVAAQASGPPPDPDRLGGGRLVSDP